MELAQFLQTLDHVVVLGQTILGHPEILVHTVMELVQFLQTLDHIVVLGQMVLGCQEILVLHSMGEMKLTLAG